MHTLKIILITLTALLFTACSPKAPAPETEETIPFTPDFTFRTTDREGNSYTEEIFAGQKLTIINFWEPWCGPCVSEMPDLEKLRETYADRGLLILGVYATGGMEEMVDAVLQQTGVTYPILHYADDFQPLQTGYVPNTIAVDGTGKIVYGPVSGMMTYEQWAELAEKYL